MAISKKLQSLLEQSKTDFEAIEHKVVYTGFDLAQTTKAALGEVLKTVLVKGEQGYTLAVLPASRMLDFKKLAKALNSKKLDIAKEAVMKKDFSVEPGSMTPFGVLYQLPVLLDKSALKAKTVVARAGSFQDSVRLKVRDLVALASAQMADFTSAMKMKKPLKVKAKPVKKSAKKGAKKALAKGKKPAKKSSKASKRK